MKKKILIAVVFLVIFISSLTAESFMSYSKQFIGKSVAVRTVCQSEKDLEYFYGKLLSVLDDCLIIESSYQNKNKENITETIVIRFEYIKMIGVKK
jgi:hypothetical protein